MNALKFLPQHRLLQFFFTVALALTAMGWASASETATDALPQPKSDKGMVCFYREKKFAGWQVSYYNIKESNAVIGALRNGSYFYYEVSPGTYTFLADMLNGKSSRTVTVEAGKTYYIAGSLENGVLGFTPKLSIVSEMEGKSVVPGLKHVAKDTK
jgi:hypothetical protein